MQSFIPFPVIKCDQFPGGKGANNYLNFVLSNAKQWALNIDMDCFIFNFQEVLSLWDYMKKNNYTHCGIRDLGAISHRRNTADSMNPFFNLFDCQTLRNRVSFPVNEGREDGFEPFNLFFKILKEQGNPLNLGAGSHPDGISTYVKSHEGTPFALHSWYSRDYLGYHHNRIRKVISEAMALRMEM